MLSTVGLEVTSSDNSDLSWKTVTKGRRSRKPVTKNTIGGSEMGSKSSPKRVGDFSSSDSDKFGEAGVGRHCDDKVEHLPIKKRRPLRQSASPPPGAPSLSHEENSCLQPNKLDQLPSSANWSSDFDSDCHAQVVDGLTTAKHGSGADDRVVEGKGSEISNENLYNPEDFSGIGLLAAAACINSMECDVDNEKEDQLDENLLLLETSHASFSSQKESISSVEPQNFSRDGMVNEDDMKTSLVLNSSCAVSRSLHDSEDGGAAGKLTSSRVDRLHWDLNTVMDAWEEPSEDHVVSNLPVDGFSKDVKKPKLDTVGRQLHNGLNDGNSGGESRSPNESKDATSDSCSLKIRAIKTEEFCGPDMSCSEQMHVSVHTAHSLIDALKQPSDNPVVGSVSNNASNEDVRRKLETAGYQTNGVSGGSQHHYENNKSVVLKAVITHAPGVRIAEIKKEQLSGPERNCTEQLCLPNYKSQSMVPENDSSSDIKPSIHVVNKNLCHVASIAESAQINPVPKEQSSSEFSGSSNFVEDGCRDVAGLSPVLPPISKQNVALPEMPGAVKSVCETDIQINGLESSGRKSEVFDSKISLKEIVPSCETPEVGRPRVVSNEINVSIPSAKSEDASCSGAVVEGQSMVVGDTKCQEDRVSASDVTPTDVQADSGNRELISECNHQQPYGEGSHDNCHQMELQNEDPTGDSLKIGPASDDGHNSDVSEGDLGQMVSAEFSTELQAGYDSFEDGELRLRSWEENDVDEENKSVEYESDGRNDDDSDAADCPGSEVVEDGSEGSEGTEKRSLSATNVGDLDFKKSDSVRSSLRRQFKNDAVEKNEMGAKDVPNSGSATTMVEPVDMVVEGKDPQVRRRGTAERVDASEGKDSCAEEIGSRTLRGKLQSRIEGPSSLEVSDKKDTVFTQQNRSNFGGSYSRLERDTSPDKFVSRYGSACHARGRNGVDGKWPYWGSRNRYASSYHGLENNSQIRPRNTIINSEKFGVNSHDHRESINYSPKGLHRPPIRRRSPIERDDDCYGLPRRAPLGRGMSMNRSRGNFGNYSRGSGRGLREDYHDHMPDTAAASSVRIPHYLPRRDRSYSPSGRGGHLSISRRKSRSRSRSRSPRAWHPQIERSIGTRRHSRSPDFRSEARIDRIRMPLSKPPFVADYRENFMSPPRSRFPAQRNCRGEEDRSFVDNQMRSRRSPVRIFRRNQGYDSTTASGRLKDDYFRPMGGPGRFAVIAGAGRGCKFEDNYDDRRRDDRFEMMPRIRHSESGGVMRQFRHDADDVFEGSNPHNEDGVRY